jgi:hypothetical protein
MQLLEILMSIFNRRSVIFFLTIFLVIPIFATNGFAAPGQVKVFILAGQSNMEGKAKVSLLEKQYKDPVLGKQFKHLKKDGRWVERPDVWISYLNRRGKLTVGYGSDKSRFGPELEFGMTMGDHYKEQVLIIKTAWGGKSLAKDFRSPSAGDAGPFYKKMNELVKDTLKNLGAYFPAYKKQGYELCGFVWFQGWNDMINKEFTGAYAENMGHFIRDVRKEYKSPKLPFVIGQLGVGGEKVNPKVQTFKDAQAAVLKRSEFKNNVSLVKTDQYWDKAAHAVFKKGWRKHIEEWNKVGGDFPFHYLGSCITFSKIGRGFAKATLKLIDKK